MKDPPGLVTRQYLPQISGLVSPLLRGGERFFDARGDFGNTAFGVDRVGIRLYIGGQYIGDQFQVDERSTALSAAVSAGFDSPAGI